MEEWKEYKLGEFVQFNPKERIAKGQVTRKIAMDQLVPFCRDVSSNTYEEYKGGAKFKNGDTIMARITPCLENGKTCYISSLESDEVAFGSTEYIVLRNIKNISDSRFIYYLSICPQIREVAIKSMVGSSGRQRVQQDVLENYCIKLPSLPTQQKIANILSSLDDKIEVNRRINEQLEELAQALFKSWFVDFEPFKDGAFVESELGMIPEGWKVGTLGEYCKVKSGFAFKSSWWQDNGLKVIKIKNITSDGVLDMNDCSYVSSENTLKAKDFKTNVGDLLIAMTGATIGKFCIISSKEEMYVNQRVGKFFLGDNPILKLPFIYCTLKTERVYSEIVNKGQGSAQPNISGSDIENIHIPMPLNIDLLSLFNGKLKSIFEKMIHNQQEIHHLTTLRDTLLPKLMSGEIDVSEVEV